MSPKPLRRSRPLLALFGIIAVTLLGIALFSPATVAQTLTLDIGEPGGSTTARLIQLVAAITLLSIAPGILVTVTSFTRLVIVFSLLRTALGTQQSPPNLVMISLALFLTGFIMAPTLEQAWQDGISPLIDERIDEFEAFERAVAPFRTFMLAQVRDKDLQLFEDIGQVGPAETGVNAPLKVLVPAFMISELRRAFEIGFLIYLPFVIIDMVVASILMSMGMMMVPPVIVSLPFKLIFFVLVDGWYLIAGSMVRSFGAG
ncbi:flagellar type III secretion system pore protein FliP [Nisaea acidiphila]|uniref:Flagellar biosynthetic protein FliP n=1 Tax=Nisaea acidiphila TaxID=1862145 RepID=A0A9J7AS64_9PROT|nr:flagellar type III secretion system pore protein FliP [Nisaea acidiphila]UUX50475.1 flagellar type III secretion system pore protein FliP [Nisaea acidiphila]